MGLFGAIGKALLYSLAIVGLAVVVFVVLSYGWDGEPPEVSFEATDDADAPAV